ncbi:Signal transduction histidine kinase [Actinokineospora alba]|uniref:Signal transduction histidine-protein kinase/phosphatase MprB n=1 Tax=Actinokineospora alba TaxID=504798 RepID=A0A1H0PIL2_9PSEU|nr:HAMP domain-containing sensor histidine kinase [Actinokineospora alba]TDP65815.1 signal transduction histidine kinase [Actinokineospora alba]SDI64488.1 Signal transduction histidine kinase [Actinokineospora alba]SDP04911.1 Signal transduction histidine kinase [Actinokineospora alba]
MKRASIAVRITALALAVAGVVAVIGGLVSARLVVQTAREVTRQTLSDQADVVAGQLSDSKLGLRRVVEVLGGQGVAVVQVRPNGNVVSSDATAERAARQAGITELTGPVHTTVELNGRVLLVELRPADPRGAIGLVRETETAKGVGRTLVRNIAFALGLGLLVAAVAGLVLARLLSRPLRRTAAVATSMSHGRRDLRAPVDGPREVAEVAAAVNELADALHRSEARQRDFLLSVSHELRTPLTAVKGFAESLADGVVTGDAVAAAGRTIDQEATRLDRLVTDLLDLARLGADDFRLDVVAVDLTALVAETATVWSARCATAGIRFTLEAPPDPVIVHADPRRLRQVLDGLAENALRATPSGRPMVLALSRAPGAAVLQVRDGGPGLAPEEYQVAFERGVLNARYSGSRPVGTGIGLALVHGLVSRMGGVIEAGPAPEGGAAFTVRFRTA